MHGPALDAALFVDDALEHHEFFLMRRADERERSGDRQNDVDVVRVGCHGGQCRDETHRRGCDDGNETANDHKKMAFHTRYSRASAILGYAGNYPARKVAFTETFCQL